MKDIQKNLPPGPKKFSHALSLPSAARAGFIHFIPYMIKYSTFLHEFQPLCIIFFFKPGRAGQAVPASIDLKLFGKPIAA